MLQGSPLTNSVWGKEYLLQDTHRLQEHCKWLEQQLEHMRREDEKLISTLNSAHSKALLDRRNTRCEGCLRMFGEVHLAPCFHLLCQACYPPPSNVYQVRHHGPFPQASGSHTRGPRSVRDFHPAARSSLVNSDKPWSST